MVGVLQLNEHALCLVPASWAPMVANRLFNWSPPTRESACPQHGGPVSGPPQTTPRVHPWHQHSQSAAGSSEAMEETDSTEVKYKIRQWSLPGATIVCSTLAVEFSGLNWMTKLYWTAIGFYRRVSCAMCFRRSVQLHGRALVEKGSQLVSCYQAVKMRMTG